MMKYIRLKSVFETYHRTTTGKKFIISTNEYLNSTVKLQDLKSSLILLNL